MIALDGTADGGYLAMGFTQTLAVADADLWVLKLDADAFLSDCPAIQQFPGEGSGIDTSESPVNPVVTVTDESPVRLTWSAVVTEAPVDHLFSGDGCRPVALTDQIDLPRTGQTISYYEGDDGDIRAGVDWPEPRFTDNGNGTLTDRLTGLIWLKDAGCLGSHNLGDAYDTVSDFNANPAGYACSDYDADHPLSDWRLPNINELASVVNYEIGDKAAWLAAQGFADVISDKYWSSSRFADHILQGWDVSLETGYVLFDYNSYTQRVWAVRGGQKSYPDSDFPANVPIPKTGWSGGTGSGDAGLQMGVFWPDPRFTDNGDGTVTDNLTGLTWLQDAWCFETDHTQGLIPWEAALDAVAAFNADPASFACTNYDVAHHQGDWRLPNNRELFSLVDWSRANPALPAGHPFVDVSSHYYWSSNTFDDDAPSPMEWVVRLGVTGGTAHFLKAYSYGTIWPVRGGTHNVADRDADGIPDATDNCPSTPNSGQENMDADGPGDACDACPADPANDADGDGVCGDLDNCPSTANPGQEDLDGNGVGDACESDPGGSGDSGGGGGGGCFISTLNPGDWI